MKLTALSARKILNSRKEETISVIAESGKLKAEASAPSGKSKGKHEVKDFSTRGLNFSISFISNLAKDLTSKGIGFRSFEDLSFIEQAVREYDKTSDLSFIGGNTLFAVEAAVLKLLAASQGKELWQFLYEGKGKPRMPMPLGNCIGGGSHVKQEKKADFQEFLLLPKTNSFFDAYFANTQAYKEAQKLLSELDYEWKNTITDESAFAATISNEKILDLLQQVQDSIKTKLGISLSLGLDVAASSFWKSKNYWYKNFSSIKKKELSQTEQVDYLIKLAKKYNLAYLEDPFHEEDFGSFSKLLSKVPSVMVCGDDLTCTHLDRVKKAVRLRAVNCLIIKPNQVGSLIETKKVLDFAKANNIKTVISHRSGETTDTIISHLAVGWQADMIKTGILGRERLAKLNEIIRIEKSLN